jgi:hypothetical protein
MRVLDGRKTPALNATIRGREREPAARLSIFASSRRRGRGRILYEGLNGKGRVDRMTDTTTRRPIRVSADGTSVPYIMVPIKLLDRIRKLLVENDIPHWVDHNAISVDGRPAVTVINLGRGADSSRVQELLDAAA